MILPIGRVGEICARGPSTMLKYYNNPDATSETIDKDRWLHTGDLGRMDKRGYIEIAGRVKEMIIRGGENHFPAEIENVLRQHDEISDVAIVGIPDVKWGEIIAAFIKFRDKPILAKDLKLFSRQEMSPQKTPSIWVAVEQFPLTGSGKIQKFKLIEKFQSGQFQEMK
jgi:fatty-acyl-CoA synthase